MEIFEKAKILGSAGGFDSCGPKMCEVKVDSGLGGIYHAKAEHKTCRIFKTLMDNSCSFDCKYCQNAKGCDKQRAKYEPDELANLFMYLNKNLAVEGLFLSSGIGSNPNKSTENMLDAIKIIRNKHQFKGYIHFKVLPGTNYDLIKQASELSTRMSINLEAPNKEVMSELSSCKDYKTDILRRQSWISRLKLISGQTTQMILNKNSSDKDVLKMVDWEYDSFNLKRVYFSAFRPVKGTAFENEKAESIIRQNHLYNSDFLLRDYGYKIKEFDSIMNDGMLPSEDPKMAIAKANIIRPIDINEASYEELIRIPGIGPRTADNILNKIEKIRKHEELKKMGAILKRANPFINVDGRIQKSLTAY